MIQVPSDLLWFFSWLAIGITVELPIFVAWWLYDLIIDYMFSPVKGGDVV